MSSVISTYSNFEIFVLKSEYSKSLVLLQEPDGWKEDELQMTRHQEYHGIFVSFTNSLVFRGEAIDYINFAYNLGGINTELRLTKYELKDIDDEIKYVEVYSSLADFTTKKEKDNGLEIHFNSNELEELIKSHKTDIFEIERRTSIDDLEIDELSLNSLELEGRTITGVGESDVNTELFKAQENDPFTDWQEIPVRTSFNNTHYYGTAVTRKISDGPERFSTVDSIKTDNDVNSSHMFFQRTDLPGVDVNIDIQYDIEGFYVASIAVYGWLVADLVVWEWDGNNFNEVSRTNIGQVSFGSGNWNPEVKFKGEHSIKELKYNQGVSIVFYTDNPQLGWYPYGNFLCSKHNIKLVSYEFYQASPSVNFIFFYNCVERLMYIITGKKNKFYSKYFGSLENGYVEDGEGGLIGIISGYWARAFDPASEKYKSLQISLDDCIKSAQAVFNIGVGIETVNFEQRLRFEKLEYFYQDEVVVKFPFQLNNVVRTIDSNLFFSGTELGFNKGGDYEDTVGLDEPNTVTSTVTPIRKSNKKYVKKSNIRGDDTGLELVRRKPQSIYPDEDTNEDDNNWFLDLKRILNGFAQKIWSDRLISKPLGVNSPENYKGMFFTPLRILFRHGFILRSGLEPYYNKLIKYANSKLNSKLEMHFIGESKPYKENDDILVNELKRSKFTPDIIEAEHPIDDELLDWIKGSTKTLVNGEYENIPNVYFKMEFINEKGETERGYLLDLKPKGIGKLKFQKANEKLIN